MDDDLESIDHLFLFHNFWCTIHFCQKKIMNEIFKQWLSVLWDFFFIHPHSPCSVSRFMSLYGCFHIETIWYHHLMKEPAHVPRPVRHKMRPTVPLTELCTDMKFAPDSAATYSRIWGCRIWCQLHGLCYVMMVVCDHTQHATVMLYWRNLFENFRFCRQSKCTIV